MEYIHTYGHIYMTVIIEEEKKPQLKDPFQSPNKNLSDL